MELSERLIKQLESEYPHVYEWQDPAGTEYPSHAHNGKVSLFVTDGSITFSIAGEQKEVKAGERLDIPPGVEHSAVVGPQGWIVIVGEEFEGDSQQVVPLPFPGKWSIISVTFKRICGLG